MRKLNRLHMGVMLAAIMLAGVRSAAAQAIEFPIHANDLKPGERIVTVVHAPGGGPQTGAKDLRILRRVADNDWQVLKDGKTDEAINFRLPDLRTTGLRDGRRHCGRLLA